MNSPAANSPPPPAGGDTGGLPRPRSASRRLQASIERWRSGRQRAIVDDLPSPPESDPVRPDLRFGAITPPQPDESETTRRTRTEVRNLRRLQEVIHFLSSATDVATLVPEVLDLALSLSGFTRGLLALQDRPRKGMPADAEREYSVRLIRGIAREERRSPEVRVLRRLLSQALESRQPAFEPDVRRAPCADQEPGADALALGAAVVLPLEANGKLLGAILLDDPGRSAIFEPAEVELLKSYSRHAALALARTLRTRELQKKRDKALAKLDELAAQLAAKERELEELKNKSASRRLPLPANNDRDRLDELFEKTYPRAKRSFLRRYLRDVVERCHGDLERAARHAGLTVAKLARLLDLHEIPRPQGPRVHTGSDLDANRSI